LDAGLGEHADHIAGDGGHELAVGLREDVLLLAGDEEVGQGGADDVGDLGGIEATRGRRGPCRQGFPPIEVGLASAGERTAFLRARSSRKKGSSDFITGRGAGGSGKQKGGASAVAGAGFLRRSG
jgi:hypothetical protein